MLDRTIKSHSVFFTRSHRDNWVLLAAPLRCPTETRDFVWACPTEFVADPGAICLVANELRNGPEDLSLLGAILDGAIKSYTWAVDPSIAAKRWTASKW